MAFKVVWTQIAIKGFDKVIQYLDKNWTEKEINKFIIKTKKFIDLLSVFPEMLSKTSKYKNLYRGPINKYTIITYRLKQSQKVIEVINISPSKACVQTKR